MLGGRYRNPILAFSYLKSCQIYVTSHQIGWNYIKLGIEKEWTNNNVVKKILKNDVFPEKNLWEATCLIPKLEQTNVPI